MSDKQRPIGPCNAHKNTTRMYLGPGEGTVMRDAIQAAHKWVHELLPPDLVIRHRWSDNFEVHAHMLCYQSPYLFRRCKPYLEPDPIIANTGLLPVLNIPDPVHPKHMEQIVNFLYTGSYSVAEHDVLCQKFLGGPLLTCWPCYNHARLLAFHLGMIRSAMFLGLEDLRYMAQEKFCLAIEGASLPVLQRIVLEVYSMKAYTTGSKKPCSWNQLPVDDFRSSLVVPTVLRYIENRGQKLGEEQFRTLRVQFPQFASDLELGISASSIAWFSW